MFKTILYLDWGSRGRSKAQVVDPSVAVRNLRAADRRWERAPPAIQSGAHRAIELDQESFGNKRPPHRRSQQNTPPPRFRQAHM